MICPVCGFTGYYKRQDGTRYCVRCINNGEDNSVIQWPVGRNTTPSQLHRMQIEAEEEGDNGQQALH